MDGRGRSGIEGRGIVLGEALAPNLSRLCYHVAGHGGAKAAVRAVRSAVGDARFVFRSDVKGYYASIEHGRLVALVRELVPDCTVIGLIERYLGHVREVDGVYGLVTRGSRWAVRYLPFSVRCTCANSMRPWNARACFMPGSWMIGWSCRLHGGNCARRSGQRIRCWRGSG